MKLYIKNMVCNRCKMVVKTELAQLGFNPVNVQLGEVELEETNLSFEQYDRIKSKLHEYDFELLMDRKLQLTELIKTTIINLVHYSTEPLKVNLSTYLSEKLNLEYAHLGANFTETENSNIEKYFIEQKIEKVKELLAYNEQSLSEIAYLLNYSSVAHLSTQFKKVTGQTPTVYKQTLQRRKGVDHI